MAHGHVLHRQVVAVVVRRRRSSTNCCRRAATGRCANWSRTSTAALAARAGEIVAEAGLGRMACADVSREQADTLLKVAREHARAVTPKRLGAVGPDLFPDWAYAHVERRQRRSAPDRTRRRFPSSSRLGPKRAQNMGDHRLRQPHAGHRRHRCGARQAGDRPVRLRARAHRRRSTEGQRTSPSG